MRVERYSWLTLWLLTSAVIVTHLLGVWSPAEFWGANFYRFLPRGILVAACAIVATVTLFTRITALDRALLAVTKAPNSGAGGATIKAVLAVGASFTIFWVFREGHTLLGDGHSLVSDLPRGQQFHPHEPLTYLVHHWFYRLARGLFLADARSAADVARATVGLSSALAGGLFVPVAWGLAREISRTVEPDPADAPVPTSRTVVPLVLLVVMGQGYVQLFFGYVENYTFNALVLAVYLLASMRQLRHAAPLAAPGLALVLTIALDLSGVLLVPSFLFLLTNEFLSKTSRWRLLRDLVLTSAFAIGLNTLLASVQPGYNLVSEAYWVVLQALIGHGHHVESVNYIFSVEHIRDFLNEQVLIGPAGAFMFVGGLVWLVMARIQVTSVQVFYVLVGLISLAGAWVTTDLSLGYARDWDIFAPTGLAFTAAGLYCLISGSWRGTSLRRWLVVLLSVSMFHTVPWIAVNASFDRSFARLKTLPLGLGRTEAVVGLYYLEQGDTTQAIRWFQRSLDANPENSIAAYSLGQIGMKQGAYPWAAQAFRAALQSRPDKEMFRLALVDAIVRGGGRPQWAKPHLDTLVMRNPREPTYWAALGVVWLGLAQRDSAALAFDHARRLTLEDSTFHRLSNHLTEADGYLRAVEDDWPAIVER